METFVAPYVQIQPDEVLKKSLDKISRQYDEMPTLTTAIPGMPLIDLSKYMAKELVSIDFTGFMNAYPLATQANEGANEYNRSRRPLLQVGDLLHLRDYDHWVVLMPKNEFAWVYPDNLKQYKSIDEMQFPHELLEFLENNQPTIIPAVFRSMLLHLMTSTRINETLASKSDDRLYEGKLEALDHLKTCLMSSIKMYLDGRFGKPEI